MNERVLCEWTSLSFKVGSVFAHLLLYLCGYQSCITVMYNLRHMYNIMYNSQVWDSNLFLGWDTLWGLLVLWSPGFLPWEPPAAFFVKKDNMKQEVWKDTNQTEKKKKMTFKSMCCAKVAFNNGFTWTCRCCRHGQSGSSYRWGPAVRPSEVSDCCSGSGQAAGPCSLRSTFGWLGPRFCWILPAEWKYFMKNKYNDYT